MPESSRPLTYPVLRNLISHLKFPKRKEVARRVSSIRSVEKSIPYNLKSVQITEDYAANCFILWIDGMVIRFDRTERQNGLVRIVTVQKSTIDLPETAINRCLDYYLNRPDLHIKQFTINRAAWPLKQFFPSGISSMKIIVGRGTERSLKQFKDVRFKRVIVDNSFNDSSIFALPMVHNTANLSIRSVEMQNDELLNMPLNSFATVHSNFILNATFTDFCLKLLKLENPEIGTSFTGHSFVKNFNLKRLLTVFQGRSDTKKSMWNGRKSTTIDMGDDKELVITYNLTGTVFEPKHHVTATILKKGSSVDRIPGIVQNLVNVFNGIRLT
ncbi:hypothetical protein GCK72_006405 [Caenorhabditis remanei]|uniref:F-box domain-containing protein n=1 Tax=Caenorhabditis remanei TaxID=31234 RepID=A0A6A5HF59_CAERE|nr:hypothetical protein GCK72_006405 [Caenorhabditis remanei]KAF1766448.1 hypothetical protein GCK72_006405 [Caenorhabditis remanei]